jgi:hypothetical protein
MIKLHTVSQKSLHEIEVSKEPDDFIVWKRINEMHVRDEMKYDYPCIVNKNRI